MKILHISDFHYGSSSLEVNTIYPTIPEDYLYKTNKFILNNLDLLDLIIFTGDLVSKGKTSDLKNPIIIDFLDPFIKRDIPILMCNGNHEIEEKKIKNNIQFSDYTNFIKENKKKFKIELSNNFSQNLASFFDFPDENLLFISLNSCFNIKTNQEKDFKKPGTIAYKLTDQFFNELRQELDDNEFQYRNKIVILHHPLELIKNHLDSIRILNENDVKLTISGHYHKYSTYQINGITGLTAGTLYGSNKIKWDDLNLIMHPNQFNYYEIDALNKKLTVFQYIIELEQNTWNLKEKSSIDIPFLAKWTLVKWCIEFGLNAILNDLKKKRIKYVYEDTSKKADFIGVKKNKKTVRIFFLTVEDQNKVKLIKSHINDKIIKRKDLDLLVIDKTGKLKGQLPSEMILECVKK